MGPSSNTPPPRKCDTVIFVIQNVTSQERAPGPRKDNESGAGAYPRPASARRSIGVWFGCRPFRLGVIYWGVLEVGAVPNMQPLLHVQPTTTAWPEHGDPVFSGLGPCFCHRERGGGGGAASKFCAHARFGLHGSFAGTFILLPRKCAIPSSVALLTWTTALTACRRGPCPCQSETPAHQ